MALVDSQNEDEVERATLFAKPSCFLIIGKPGMGKSTLAKKIADSWNCILIDDTELLNRHIKDRTKEGKEFLEFLNEGKCVPEDLVLQLIIARLTSPDVKHYGYVLSCLPSMSEMCLKIQEQIDMIKKLEFPPDFLINIKCADVDLIQRLSGLRQHPVTGQVYLSGQLTSEKPHTKMEEGESLSDDGDQSDDNLGEKEQAVLSKDDIQQMVWTQNNSAPNVALKIKMYKDIMLKPLEDYMSNHDFRFRFELDGNSSIEELHVYVMSRLESMALKRVAVPVRLHENEDEEFQDDIETEALLRCMCSLKTVAPGFRWRRSRWGRTCPVRLKEGQIVEGKPQFCVGFQAKLYILSSQEAYHKFVINPRRYLLPPMPRPPCKVTIVGPPRAGKSTLCGVLAKHYGAFVIDVEELMRPVALKLEQKRLQKIEEATAKLQMKELESTQASETEDQPVDVLAVALLEAKETSTSLSPEMCVNALKQRIDEIEEADGDAEVKTGWVLDNFPKNRAELSALQNAGIFPDTFFCLRDSEGFAGRTILSRIYKANKELSDQESESADGVQPVKWEQGYPEGPEMDNFRLQLKQFAGDWDSMETVLTCSFALLEISNKSPEDLLEQMVFQMEKPFQYVAWELSEVDLAEEEEDAQALSVLEKTFTKDDDEEEFEDDEKETEGSSTRVLGDSSHFCPVVLKERCVILPCIDEFAAKYREKTYYFSGEEARERFIRNPQEFVAQDEPLKPPALRIFLIGVRGSGKTTHGTWLAEQLGLFHIQFRERLQELILAKTRVLVPRADDMEITQDDERGEEEDGEESPSEKPEVVLTEEEEAIKSYLSDGEPLPAEVLDVVLGLYWEQEPFKSTGFILEGFPQNREEVNYMVQQHLFPDVTVIMAVEVTDVLDRQLPHRMEAWRERRRLRRAQQKLARELRKNIWEEAVAKRRAELLTEKAAELTRRLDQNSENDTPDEEDEIRGREDGVDDEVEAILHEEFPPEEEEDDTAGEEMDEAAVERLEMEIGVRYESDDSYMATVKELLSERNVPEVTVNAARKPRAVRCQLLRKIQPLLTNRESLFQQCQHISYSLARKLLQSSYKFHSAFGCWDPVKFIEGDLLQSVQGPLSVTFPLLLHQFVYFFASQETRAAFTLNPLKYLKQKPCRSIPITVAIIGPMKSGKTTVAKMFAQEYGLARLSIGSAMRMVLAAQGHTDLAAQMKKALNIGLSVPDELAIRCLEVVLMSLVCSTRGYVLDGFPLTHKQAELMESRCITPMIVVELELDTAEVLKRGLMDKMKPKSYLMHDSSEILHIRNSHYKTEGEHVRRHFKEHYENWSLVDGLKSKWWVRNHILKELHLSRKYIHSYLEKSFRGQAASVHRLCITPKELQARLGEFIQYCPVCLAMFRHLVDCSEAPSLALAAEYKKRFYKMCCADHQELFLATPDQFVMPGCPHALPLPHLLPRKLTEAQLKDRFPQAVEMKGFCPVTYLDGKQSYQALVRGHMEFAVEYRERIYIFETKQKQQTFLMLPETYCDQQLPNKLPPVCEPLHLTSLPMLGYLEQGVAEAIIKAMTAVGCVKPKYPFLSVQRSALLYMAYYLKAFNQNSSDFVRQKYKQRLASFEETCALIPYLGTTMTKSHTPLSEQTIDFKFKLNRFLALGELP